MKGLTEEGGGRGRKRKGKKRQTIGMKWTVVKASASPSIKQSGGDDLLSQEEQGLCSVCILYVFWWSCGPYRGGFLKHEIIILRVVEKRRLKLTNWNFWLALFHFFFVAINFLTVFPRLPIFPPVYHDVSRRLSHSHSSYLSPHHPLHPSFLRLLAPWS